MFSNDVEHDDGELSLDERQNAGERSGGPEPRWPISVAAYTTSGHDWPDSMRGCSGASMVQP